jgi:hypothetical protein
MTWIKRITDAKKRGRFTFKDHHLANWWDSCAIGERTNGDPWKYLPNKEIWYLGHQFAHAVGNDKVQDAENLLKRIQKVRLTVKT